MAYWIPKDVFFGKKNFYLDLPDYRGSWFYDYGESKIFFQEKKMVYTKAI